MADNPTAPAPAGASASHFEILRLEGRRWKFHGTAPAADEAIEAARALRDAGTRAVKVTREEFDPATSSFKRRTIFLDGETRSGPPGTEDEEDEEPTFCWKVEDFYSLPGRMMIGQILRDALDRWNITPTELIHSAAHVDRLQATGTLMQHAVQRLAIQQVQNTGKRVTERVKELHELIGVGSRRLFDLDRKGALPVLEAGGLAGLLDRIDTDIGRLFLFNAALAAYLGPAGSWRGKLQMCLMLLAEPGIAPGQRPFVIQAVDSVVAELLAGRYRLDALMGRDEDMAGALELAGGLFVGRLDDAWPDLPDDLRLLNAEIAINRFPQSRRALARRILAEVQAPRKRTDGDLKAELGFFARLSALFERATGNLMGIDEIRRAFNGRIESLLTASHVADYLGEDANPFDRIARLLELEPVVLGLGNKRRLAGFIGPVLSAPDAEAHLAPGDARAPAAMRRLAELQRRIAASDLDPEDAGRLGAALDRLCVAAMERSRFLERLTDGPGEPVDRAFALMKACATPQFTRGKAEEKARRTALELLAAPGVLAGYLEAGGPAERAARLKSLRTGLAAAGVRGTL